MGKKKLVVKKRKTSKHMHDKYWRSVLNFVENKDWDQLEDYVGRYPWLSKATMGPSILPEYLAGEKNYGLLRLLCNHPEVPVLLIRSLIGKGAVDREGRAYLERLLITGQEEKEEKEENGKPTRECSPLVAAAVLLTCSDIPAIIERMHGILQAGLEDKNEDRQRLAEQCIGNSQPFYDLLMLLYEHDKLPLLEKCLGSDAVMLAAAEGKVESISDLESLMSSSCQ